MGYKLNVFGNGVQVGTGTGISPMVGFLQARAEALRQGTKLAPCHVYFGCRDSSEVGGGKGWGYSQHATTGQTLRTTRSERKPRLRNTPLTRATIGVQ